MTAQHKLPEPRLGEGRKAGKKRSRKQMTSTGRAPELRPLQTEPNQTQSDEAGAFDDQSYSAMSAHNERRQKDKKRDKHRKERKGRHPSSESKEPIRPLAFDDYFREAKPVFEIDANGEDSLGCPDLAESKTGLDAFMKLQCKIVPAVLLQAGANCS